MEKGRHRAAAASFTGRDLEAITDRHLHNARIPGRGDDAKVGRPQAGRGVIEVHGIEQVKDLPTDIDTLPFRNPEPLRQVEIGREESRPIAVFRAEFPAVLMVWTA